MNVNKKLLIILNHLICLIGGFHTPIANIAHNSNRNRRCINKSIKNNDNYNYQYQHKDVTKLNLSNNINNDDNNDDGSKTGNNNSKTAITAISSIGVIETLYLTWSKLSSSNVLFCTDDGSTGGCSDVLNGPYGSLSLFSIDIPLPLFGVLAYSIVTLLSLKDNKNANNDILLLITTSMATFSSFLVYLLLFVIHDTCPYCFLSASLSFTLFILALRLATTSDDDNKDDGNIYIQSSTISKVFTSVLATALSSILLFSNISAQPTLYANAKTAPETEMTTPQITTTTTNEGQVYTPPKITTSSSSTALSLGQTLKSLDSKMYGAYWCSHCYEQKQTLGKEVFVQKYVTYIECDKEGLDSQRSLCKERKVPGYPTWEIGGKLFPGEQSIGELEDIASEMASALNVK